MTPSALRLPTLLLLAALGGCDQLGIEAASAVAARREAEGKAVGAACRHAGRAIEDCYALNRRTDKGAIFAGWREMNDYMHENKIDVVAPTLAPPSAAVATKEDDADAPAAASAPPAPRKGAKAGRS